MVLPGLIIPLIVLPIALCAVGCYLAYRSYRRKLSFKADIEQGRARGQQGVREHQLPAIEMRALPNMHGSRYTSRQAEQPKAGLPMHHGSRRTRRASFEEVKGLGGGLVDHAESSKFINPALGTAALHSAQGSRLNAFAPEPLQRRSTVMTNPAVLDYLPDEKISNIWKNIDSRESLVPRRVSTRPRNVLPSQPVELPADDFEEIDLNQSSRDSGLGTSPGSSHHSTGSKDIRRFLPMSDVDLHILSKPNS